MWNVFLTLSNPALTDKVIEAPHQGNPLTDDQTGRVLSESISCVLIGGLRLEAIRAERINETARSEDMDPLTIMTLVVQGLEAANRLVEIQREGRDASEADLAAIRSATLARMETSEEAFDAIVGTIRPPGEEGDTGGA